tara:strand:+ start:532 stop:933 length:402 start_codon:yes stop_codon:yes gene_type:complete
MNNLTITLILILTLSLGLNVFCYWYIRNLLSRFLFISTNLEDLVAMVRNYRTHLKKIYSMEMFYGDESLKHLVEHTTFFADMLEEYEEVIYITDPLEETDEGDSEETQEEPNNAPTQTNQENVFYAGTRRRDN